MFYQTFRTFSLILLLHELHASNSTPSHIGDVVAMATCQCARCRGPHRSSLGPQQWRVLVMFLLREAAGVTQVFTHCFPPPQEGAVSPTAPTLTLLCTKTTPSAGVVTDASAPRLVGVAQVLTNHRLSCISYSMNMSHR